MGFKVEDQPISIAKPNKISIKGKITQVNSDSISIGSSKFLLTKDTKYANMKITDLKLDQTVQIAGEIREDNKIYTISISRVNTSQTNLDTNTNTNPLNQKSTNSGRQ